MAQTDSTDFPGVTADRWTASRENLNLADFGLIYGSFLNKITQDHMNEHSEALVFGL